MSYLAKAGLQIDPALVAFTEDRLLPGLDLDPARFWEGLATLVEQFSGRNDTLLAIRADLQRKLDDWHREHPGQPEPEPYRAMLEEIGYLLPEGPDFTITTEQVDPEVATQFGPQLVVPVTNGRFALNAVNARWGSLYAALYGSDALGSLPEGGGYDAGRGAQVIAWAKAFLDETVPLEGASYADVTGFAVADGTLQAITTNGTVGLADPRGFAGHIGPDAAPEAIILVHHGLHLILDLDRNHPIGRSDPAGISDLRLESALTVIMDCEDSVATVDAADKVLAYGNWLGLMDGTLSARFDKAGQTVTREMAGDIAYTDRNGAPARLDGRALMFVRNVGHLMTTPAVLDAAGDEVPEGLLDALFTVTAALHDLNGAQRNSAHSIYVVKPKMHGPEEVAFTAEIFAAVEDLLGLPRCTVKLGIMDEERRTSVNLKQCIRAAKDRVVFVNTGFLDRTGDEIHSSMQAGPMARKAEMKSRPWLSAYEDRNVDIALACGFRGKGQIGKGMWAMPDLMADMLDAKIAHPQAGASCAWVPSPTAATLHATHYHRVDVGARQEELAAGGVRQGLDALLTIPLAEGGYAASEIEAEILNNAQGILGYVVRWVDQGIGCSKVPDINDIGQMEDRATCRISAQMLANWLEHGVIDRDQLHAAFQKAAGIVDRQNAGDPGYRKLLRGEGSNARESLAYQAAWALAVEGAAQPSGYTEPLLHHFRALAKDAKG